MLRRRYVDAPKLLHGGLLNRCKTFRFWAKSGRSQIYVCCLWYPGEIIIRSDGSYWVANVVEAKLVNTIMNRVPVRAVELHQYDEFASWFLIICGPRCWLTSPCFQLPFGNHSIRACMSSDTEITPASKAIPFSEEFIALAQHTKTFDPFRVMGVSTKELLHSRVLAAFLDAHEPHGLGSRFRDDYLASLVNCRRVGAAQPVAVDVLQNTSGAKAKVLRELAKIDVLLDFPDLRLVVAIENKIRALDQPKQVARYQLSLCDLFPHYEHRAIVYLTPSGRDSPTANLACTRVPIYYQSYKMVADAFRRCQPQANPLAGQFIDQFIRHIDRTMTDSSEIQNLCWNVFEQNEEAYERMTQHLYYCRRRKYVTRFAALKTSILEGAQFSEWAGSLQTRTVEGNKGAVAGAECNTVIELKLGHHAA
ncbi:hypothetical protein SSTU70S_00025 [Stutzerimonas stutzeri]